MGLGNAMKLSQLGWPYPSMLAIIGVFIFPPYPQIGNLVFEEGGLMTPLKMPALKARLSLVLVPRTHNLGSHFKPICEFSYHTQIWATVLNENFTDKKSKEQTNKLNCNLEQEG